MADDERDVPELAEQIVRADEEQQQRSQAPPLPDGWWARLVERDRRARARSQPNAAGGFLGILYPWRLYIAIVGALMVVVLLLISVLDI